MATCPVIFPPAAWGEYRRHREEIRALLDPRCHRIEWLDVRILNGDALAFGNADAVIVVEVKRYPAGATELHGLVAAGELDAILPLIEQAEQWGRQSEITFASIASRPAWSRVLKDKGYSVYQTTLRKDLTNGAE